MSVHARTRVSKMGYPVTGTLYRRSLGSTTEHTAYARVDRTTSDIVGNFPNPNGFLSNHYISAVAILDGEKYVVINGQKVLDKQFSHCPVTYASPVLTPYYPLPTSTEVNTAVIDAVASTNPSSPDVSIPVQVGELKDVPGAVKDWGRRLLSWRRSRSVFKSRKARELLSKGVSESWLTWNWVISPMVSDMTKMLEFQKRVQSRFETLLRLRGGGTISGRGPASSLSNVSRSNVVIDSKSGELVIAARLVYDSREVWGSSQWIVPETGLNRSNLPTDDAELRSLASDLVLGMTTFETAQAAWELMPWSWFVDWFANVGNTIAATNNTVHAQPGNYCVMCRRTTQSEYTVTSCPSWVRVSVPYFEQLTVRHRQVVSSPPVPFTFASLPVIDGRQWSILGNLAALKGR